MNHPKSQLFCICTPCSPKEGRETGRRTSEDESIANEVFEDQPTNLARHSLLPTQSIIRVWAREESGGLTVEHVLFTLQLYMSLLLVSAQMERNQKSSFDDAI
jgi:hypothetical protein